MKKQSLLFVSALMCLQPLGALAMGKAQSSQPAPAPSPVAQNPAFIDAAVKQILTQEVALRTSISGRSISDKLPAAAANMPVMQAAFIGGLSSYISENPALFGGDPNRGFTPKIFNAMVQVLTERSVPMTSDGVLLPPRAGLQIRMLGNDRTASGAIKSARLFLTDDAGQLIGPNMRPITQKGFATIDGGTLGVGNESQEFAAYGNLAQALQASAIAVSSTPAASSAIITDPTTYTWGVCLGLAADDNFSEAAKCFQSAGAQTLADAAALGQNIAVTSVRGAVGGAAIGSVIPGIGTSAAAAYGALANVLSVVYNTFLRTENMSPQQIRNLMDLMSTYTMAPAANGEILPGIGQWAVTKDGYVRRVTDFGNGSLVLLDVQGNLITKDQTFVLSSSTFRTIPNASTAAPAPAANSTPAVPSASAQASAAPSAAAPAAKPVAASNVPFHF